MLNYLYRFWGQHTIPTVSSQSDYTQTMTPPYSENATQTEARVAEIGIQVNTNELNDLPLFFKTNYKNKKAHDLLEDMCSCYFSDNSALLKIDMRRYASSHLSDYTNTLSTLPREKLYGWLWCPSLIEGQFYAMDEKGYYGDSLHKFKTSTDNNTYHPLCVIEEIGNDSLIIHNTDERFTKNKTKAHELFSKFIEPKSSSLNIHLLKYPKSRFLFLYCAPENDFIIAVLEQQDTRVLLIKGPGMLWEPIEASSKGRGRTHSDWSIATPSNLTSIRVPYDLDIDSTLDLITKEEKKIILKKPSVNPLEILQKNQFDMSSISCEARATPLDERTPTTSPTPI